MTYALSPVTHRALIVDDDAETRDLVSHALQGAGFRPTGVASPAQALVAIEADRFDVMVLDVMFADEESGIQLCRRLRQDGIETPILFLSARGTVHARLEGFEAGGDDYLPKPFALREMLARVQALVRRGPALRPRGVQLGRVLLDFDRRRASAGDEELPITAREWDVLRVLADARGRVVAFEGLLERAWGETGPGARASLDVIVSRLRRKLEGPAGQRVLRTVRGQGYALEVAS